MRLLIAGVFLAAPLACGCAGSVPAFGERGDGALRVRRRVETGPRHPACPAAQLASAGGGRPRTGHLGVAAALYFASNKDLSDGWGVDLNYVHNITGRFSVEAALGTVSYALEAAGRDGGLRAVTFAAAAQYGRAFGTSRWYVGAGGAYWLNEATGLGGLDPDDAPAFIVEMGVEFQLFMRANLDFEFRYTFAESRLDGDALDLGAFAARVNCVLLF